MKDSFRLIFHLLRSFFRHPCWNSENFYMNPPVPVTKYYASTAMAKKRHFWLHLVKLKFFKLPGPKFYAYSSRVIFVGIY